MFRPSERLKGMGIGGLFLSLFGALWMVAALDAQPFLWLAACVLLPTSLLVLRSIGLIHAARQVRALEPPPTPEENAAARALNRRFGLIFMVEFGLIAIAANWLSAVGRLDWIMPGIGIIVGIHFLPLARVFDYPLYYWTGGFEIVLCLLIALGTRAHLNAADPLFGLAMGISLWVTVLIVLVQARWLTVRAMSPASTPRS